MVNNTIRATYTETYDLNTAINELSMLAVHTPQSGALRRMFHGFFEQYKKFKIFGCDITMVCASQQSLTPDLVGMEAGQVDPRDVLNPILFKACTGENINLLLNQIYNKGEALPQSLGSNSVDQHVDNRAAATNIYYQLLADDTWRKEHPQRGLHVSGLRPMVHRIVSTQPFKWTGATGTGTNPDRPLIGEVDSPNTTSSPRGFGSPSGSNTDLSQGDATNPTVFVSNGLTEMPWLDTAVVGSKVTYTMDDETSATAGNVKAFGMINVIPRVYMGCIVLPPAILQRLFFRMQVRWYVAFRDFRPSQDLAPVYNTADFLDDNNIRSLYSGSINDSTYWNMYHNAVPNSKGDAGTFGNEVSSFTTTEETEVSQIMETGS